MNSVIAIHDLFDTESMSDQRKRIAREDREYTRAKELREKERLEEMAEEVLKDNENE